MSKDVTMKEDIFLQIIRKAEFSLSVYRPEIITETDSTTKSSAIRYYPVSKNDL